MGFFLLFFSLALVILFMTDFFSPRRRCHVVTVRDGNKAERILAAKIVLLMPGR